MNSLSRFHSFMAVYEGCQSAAIGRALQTSSFAARILGIIGSVPSITLSELGRVVGGSRSQSISAALDLQHRGFIEKFEERDDHGSLLLTPVRGRFAALGAYRADIDRLATETGIGDQLALLLPQYQRVLLNALVRLCADHDFALNEVQLHLLAAVNGEGA